jgi:hypothetical protein
MMVFFNMYRNQVIGNEFHPTAIAERAEISALLSKVGEQIHALCNGIAVASGIDHKIAILCLRAGSAQRQSSAMWPAFSRIASKRSLSAMVRVESSTTIRRD